MLLSDDSLDSAICFQLISRSTCNLPGYAALWRWVNKLTNFFCTSEAGAGAGGHLVDI